MAREKIESPRICIDCGNYFDRPKQGWITGARCRSCYHKEERRRNPESVRAQKHRDYIKHKSRRIKSAIQWRRNNLERSRETSRKRQYKSYWENPGPARHRSARWMKNNPEKVREMARRGRRNLCSSYVKKVIYLATGIKDVTPELISLKRKQLLLSRELRKLKEAANG